MSNKKDKDSEPIHIWTYEQWKTGIAPPYFGYSHWTGEHCRHEISEDDRELVNAEKVRCYNELVKQRTDAKIKYWQKLLTRSRDKETLKKAEIEQVGAMLEKPETPKGRERPSVYINTYWSEYKEVIVRGDVKPHAQFYPYHYGRAGQDKGSIVNRRAERYAEVEALHGYLKYLKGESELNGPETSPAPEKQTLKDLITHEKSIDIVAGIKIQYKGIKGKRLKLLVLALQELKLLPKDRIAKKFHECCEKEFEWDIASYNAMHGYRYNDKIDLQELSEMKAYIQTQLAAY